MLVGRENFLGKDHPLLSLLSTPWPLYITIKAIKAKRWNGSVEHWLGVRNLSEKTTPYLLDCPQHGYRI
jgi:hypothetical protein